MRRENCLDIIAELGVLKVKHDGRRRLVASEHLREGVTDTDEGGDEAVLRVDGVAHGYLCASRDNHCGGRHDWCVYFELAADGARLQGDRGLLRIRFTLPEVASVVNPARPSARGAIHTGLATLTPDLRTVTSETYFADTTGFEGVDMAAIVRACTRGGAQLRYCAAFDTLG